MKTVFLTKVPVMVDQCINNKSNTEIIMVGTYCFIENKVKGCNIRVLPC